MTPNEKLVEDVARALFAVLNQQAAGHHMTDFDSEWANMRGDYMGIITPSLVDQSVEAARVVIPLVLEKAAEVAEQNRTDDGSMWDRAATQIGKEILALEPEAQS